jgi:threonine/homoserine/homoserine lactone efflux protein
MNTTNTWLLGIGTVLLVLAVIPATLILIHWRNVDWRSSDLGRVLHAKAAAIAVILWLSVIAATLLLLDYGRPWWFELLRWCAFAYVDVILWRQWSIYRSILADATRDSPQDAASELRRDTVAD